MALVKVTYGYWHTLTGATLAELAGGLQSNEVKPSNVLSCEYDAGGSLWTAIYWKGS